MARTLDIHWPSGIGRRLGLRQAGDGGFAHRRHAAGLPLPTNWDSQGLVYDPSPLEAGGQRMRLDAVFLSPGGQALRASVVCDATVLSGIALLVCGGRPTTILGAVVPIVVDAINRVTSRAGSHVCKEVREYAPAVAYCNSSPPIASVVRVVWVVAAAPHGLPCLVFSGVRSGIAAFVIGRMSCRIASSHDRTPFTRLVRAARARLRPGCSHYTPQQAGGQAHAA